MLLLASDAVILNLSDAQFFVSEVVGVVGDEASPLLPQKMVLVATVQSVLPLKISGPVNALFRANRQFMNITSWTSRVPFAIHTAPPLPVSLELLAKILFTATNLQESETFSLASKKIPTPAPFAVSLGLVLLLCVMFPATMEFMIVMLAPAEKMPPPWMPELFITRHLLRVMSMPYAKIPPP